MDITKIFSSEYLIFLFLLFVAVVFVVLYLIRTFIPLLLQGTINPNKYRKYFTIIELTVWSILLLSGIIFFLKRHLVFAIILIFFLFLLIYWWSRFVLRDYLAGLVFKIENRFTIGEIIEVNGFKGKIKHFYERNLILENEDGKKMLLPYSDLMGNIVSPKNVNETVLNNIFKIKIPSNRSFEEIRNLLKEYILLLPWFVIKYYPDIKLIGEIDNYFVVEITLYSFDESYFQIMQNKITDFVKNNFTETKPKLK